MELGVFFLGQRTGTLNKVLNLSVAIFTQSSHNVGLLCFFLSGEVAGGDHGIQIHQPFVLAVQLVAGVAVRTVVSQSVQIGIGDDIEDAEPCSLILVDIDGVARGLVVVENGRDILVENRLAVNVVEGHALFAIVGVDDGLVGIDVVENLHADLRILGIGVDAKLVVDVDGTEGVGLGLDRQR